MGTRTKADGCVANEQKRSSALARKAQKEGSVYAAWPAGRDRESSVWIERKWRSFDFTGRRAQTSVRERPVRMDYCRLVDVRRRGDEEQAAGLSDRRSMEVDEQ